MSEVNTKLEECLQAALIYYGVHADIHGLKETYLHQPGSIELEELSLIASKIGFKLVSKEIALTEVWQIDAPIILLLKDDNYSVYLPDKFGSAKIYKPGSGVHSDQAVIEEDYTGASIFVLPVSKEDDIEASKDSKPAHAIDWFWAPAKQFKSEYWEILLCSLFINIFALTMPLFSMNVYDRVVPNFAESTLIVLMIGVVAIFVFDFILRLIRSYILDNVAAKLGAQYDAQLMEQLYLIPPTQMRLTVGERANLFREIQGIRDFYAGKLAPALIDMPFFLLFLVAIYFISPMLALVPAVGAIILLLVNGSAWVLADRVAHQYFVAIQNTYSMLIEMLSGHETARMFSAVGNRLSRWRLNAKNAAQKSRRNAFVMGAISNFSTTAVYLVQVFVIFVGVYQIHAGNLTVGGLIAVSILAGRVMGPVMNLSSVVAKYKQSRDVLRSIDKIFKVPNDGDKIKIFAPKGPFKGSIELHNVSFQYEGQPRPALNQISLKINANEKVGLIGKSGAGKSTAANIMAGFLKVQNGNAFLDGFILDSISPAELRRTIGYVPQNPFFFSGTIRENLLLGRADISSQKLDEIISIAGLDLVMLQNGYGLDMEIGPDGRRLSTGQRQALSLARTLIREPQVLIMDEPTAGMDYALEERVRISLKSYLEKRTFIMVTHRTTLLPLVDRLVLLEQGRILADGPRDNVMQRLAGQ